MTAPSAKILVLRGGAIGDFICTLPALTALRKRWPEAFIELVAYARMSELARLGGLVDKVSSIDKAGIACFFGQNMKFPEELVRWIRSFDFIVSYLGDEDSLVHDNLLNAGARQVFSAHPLPGTLHATEHLFQPLNALALYFENDLPTLSLGEDHQQRGRELLQKYNNPTLLIHPGSGSSRKNWPLENFIKIARLWQERGNGPCVFSLGEADYALEPRLKSSPYPVANNLTLLDLACLGTQLNQYLGNDSGISHLMASAGCPTTALFGDTQPTQWAPRGRQVQVIAAPETNLANLPVHQVFQALEKDFCQ